MKKRSIAIIFFILVCGCILIPICLKGIVESNPLNSGIDSGYWLEFFGGFLGAIIGALVSLVGISITIHYTNEENKAGREFEKEQNKKEREANVRPYCVISFSRTKPRVNRILGELMVGYEPQSNNGPRYDCLLYIKNIGLGTAIEFDISNEELDDGRERYVVLPALTPERLNNGVSHLLPKEEAYIGITFFFNFDPIVEDDFISLDNTGDPNGLSLMVKPEVFKKYKNFNIVFNIKYHDLYGNTFSQKAILGTNMYLSVDSINKTAEHKCDINFIEATLPQRMDE